MKIHLTMDHIRKFLALFVMNFDFDFSKRSSFQILHTIITNPRHDKNIFAEDITAEHVYKQTTKKEILHVPISVLAGVLLFEI